MTTIPNRRSFGNLKALQNQKPYTFHQGTLLENCVYDEQPALTIPEKALYFIVLTLSAFISFQAICFIGSQVLSWMGV